MEKACLPPSMFLTPPKHRRVKVSRRITPAIAVVVLVFCRENHHVRELQSRAVHFSPGPSELQGGLRHGVFSSAWMWAHGADDSEIEMELEMLMVMVTM